MKKVTAGNQKNYKYFEMAKASISMCDKLALMQVIDKFDIDCCDEQGNTILHFAARTDYCLSNVLEKLNSCDNRLVVSVLNKLNSTKNSALSVGINSHKLELIKTDALYSIVNKYEQMKNVLLLNTRNTDWNSALHIYVQNRISSSTKKRSLEIIEKLIKLGCNINATNEMDLTVIDLIRKHRTKNFLDEDDVKNIIEMQKNYEHYVLNKDIKQSSTKKQFKV